MPRGSVVNKLRYPVVNTPRRHSRILTSSAHHPGSQLLSTLISLLAPSTSQTASHALHYSLHSPPSHLPSPLLLLLLLLGSPAHLRSRSFHYHNHLSPYWWLSYNNLFYLFVAKTSAGRSIAGEENWPRSMDQEVKAVLRHKQACQACHDSKVKCDLGRPCSRCIKRQATSTCGDMVWLTAYLLRSHPLLRLRLRLHLRVFFFFLLLLLLGLWQMLTSAESR